MTQGAQTTKDSITQAELYRALGVICSSDNVEEVALALEEVGAFNLIALANQCFLVFCLFAALKRYELLQLLTSQECEYLAELYEMNKQRNQLFLSELNTIILKLNSHGIEPVLLKGSVALLDHWYTDTGERFLRDVDFLVPEAQAEQAFKVLTDQGYGLVNPLDKDLHEVQSHQLAALCKEGSPLVVEIHTHPVSLKCKGLLSAEQVFADKRIGASEGTGLRYGIPSEEHCLLIALLHAEIADGHLRQNKFSLKNAVDIHRLLKKYDGVSLLELEKYFLATEFEGLPASYLVMINYFLSFPEEMTPRFSELQGNHQRLNSFLKAIEQSKQADKKALPNSELERYFYKIQDAFSAEKIAMRYEVDHGLKLQYYRLINFFRLCKKYFSAKNRNDLKQYMDESRSLSDFQQNQLETGQGNKK